MNKYLRRLNELTGHLREAEQKLEILRDTEEYWNKNKNVEIAFKVRGMAMFSISDMNIPRVLDSVIEQQKEIIDNIENDISQVIDMYNIKEEL